ncbi:uncharacterized protein IL334_003291 [Kwoniella shivajii]|uniref:Peptidase S9 prolyl oligopeptidase catalytic domain-containing protein n=1 Tax=Kwoniella shivajii TaxID=564305 RepID=A0ABZ1D048_9TREE|nr:hypothetical protein IL334_003291 [Kwoniella shivajii]
MTEEQVIIGKQWEAVGPFPSGMREHPIIASPLAAYLDPSTDPDIDFAFRPYNESETWPSEIGNGGKVGWKTFDLKDDGWLEVSYPEIRWDQLRSDHGWAALQYQTILRTSISIPKMSRQKKQTSIRIDVVQGVEYALIPKSTPKNHKGPIEWYSGDVYGFAQTTIGKKGVETESEKSTSNFARSLSLPPGEYTFLLRAIYEIRTFGDPGISNPPNIQIKVDIEVDDIEEMQIVDGLAQVPDLIDGWFMGDWISTGIRVDPEGKDTDIIEVESPHGDFFSITLPRKVKIIKGQTRQISLRLEQHKELPKDLRTFNVKFRLRIDGNEEMITWRPSLNHLNANNQKPFRITFPSPSTDDEPPSFVSFAMIVPPSSTNPKPDTSPPVILALHGAGVETTSAMWTEAMPSIPGYWSVLPTGRNEWGEDWHGGSMEDVWAAREAFGEIIKKIGVTVSDKTILMGHSNGGQGAWHLAARYPDRIEGLVAAAGWLTISDYVPYTELVSKHFADPSLMGILTSSLTPYNNDLYLSNLVDIPILVIHGSEDDNVPPRHSQAYVNTISSWSGEQNSSNVKLKEIPKQGHWWSDILRSMEIIDFIKSLPERKSWDEQRQKGFTLTTANPQESGGRAGIKIIELDTPGRIARLDVNARQWKDCNPSKPLDLRGTNIKRIELTTEPNQSSEILIKGKHTHHQWSKQHSSYPIDPVRAYGPMIRFLSTAGLITIISPDLPRHLSIAKRIAHDLFVYQSLDSEVVTDQDALLRLANGTIGRGNILMIGRPEENLFVDWTIIQNKIPISFPTKGVMLIDDKVIYDRGAGIITLHPHPTAPKGLSVLIAGNDDLGLELAARLFPIRTGVPIPDWAIVGPQARWKGSGGFIGAGFWDGQWRWNDAMSWTDR